MERKDAAEWIEKLVFTMKEDTSGKYPDPKYKDEIYEALNEAIEILKQGWIPVSERLPEMDESVLICTDKGEMTVAYHTFKEWSEIETEWFVFGTLGFALTYEDDEVLAWMPLPKPWKGDEE